MRAHESTCCLRLSTIMYTLRGREQIQPSDEEDDQELERRIIFRWFSLRFRALPLPDFTMRTTGKTGPKKSARRRQPQSHGRMGSTAYLLAPQPPQRRRRGAETPPTSPSRGRRLRCVSTTPASMPSTRVQRRETAKLSLCSVRKSGTLGSARPNHNHSRISWHRPEMRCLEVRARMSQGTWPPSAPDRLASFLLSLACGLARAGVPSEMQRCTSTK